MSYINLRISRILRFGFIIVAISLILYVADLNKFLSLTSQADVYYFSLVLVLITFDQIFMGVKWHFLLRLFHVFVPVSVPVLAYLRGRVFSFFAPSSLGIDAYKTYCVQKYHHAISPIVSSIIIERFFGALSSLLIITLLLPLSVNDLNLPFKEQAVLVSLVGVIAITVSLHLMQSRAALLLKLDFRRFSPKRVNKVLKRLLSNLAMIKDGRRQVWVYFFLSIIEKTSYGLAVYFSSRTIGLSEPGILFLIAAAPLVALLERLPISVSAIGVREGLFVLLFAPFYDDPTIPLTISLVLRAAELLQILIVAVSWLFVSDREAIERKVKSIDTEIKLVK
nr:flippase-like domain-containing protein [Gammaproteobacteria bacterium]